MSRCFPFPPPGYERKHRPEDLDILKEEKCKEKRHKKEKKERKEGKEKRERDRSDDKHRGKKDHKGKQDKKEKHPAKKVKEKDRGKEKEKSSISEEATVSGKLEENKGEQLHKKGHNQYRSIFVDEGKHATNFQGQNGGRSINNSLLPQRVEESKFVQELERRIRDDQKVAGSQLLGRVSGTEKNDEEAAVRASVRDSSGLLSEDKGKNKDKRVDDRKMGVQGFRKEFSGNTMVQNLAGMAKSKGGTMPRPVDEQNDGRLESKEKYKGKGDNNREDKHKDRDREKKILQIDKEKVRKKETEKAKGKSENKKSLQDRSKDVGKIASNKSSHLSKDINISAVNEGNLRKRKDLDSNGFLHGSEVRHHKLQKSSAHKLTDNGKKFEPCRIPVISASDKEGPNNVQLYNKDMKVNGIVEAQKLSPTKPTSSAISTLTDQIGKASKKSAHPNFKYVNGALYEPMDDQIPEEKTIPTHPDSKYLDEVLTVPKLESPEIDHQEWLFSRKRPPSNKAKVSSVALNEELHVWSNTVHIESADVYALPYVVPY